MLTKEQIDELPQKIAEQLHILLCAINEGKFSGEQIAEMKIWVESIVKGSEHDYLNQECIDLIRKLSNA